LDEPLRGFLLAIPDFVVPLADRRPPDSACPSAAPGPPACAADRGPPRL